MNQSEFQFVHLACSLTYAFISAHLVYLHSRMRGKH